jgi:hypothetical protein
LTAVCCDVFTKAKVNKSPKLLQEAAIWMTSALQQFACRGVSAQTAVCWVKELLGHSNGSVRECGVRLGVQLHRHHTSDVLHLLEADVKPSLLVKLQEACAQDPDSPASPTRQERKTAPAVMVDACSSKHPDQLDSTTVDFQRGASQCCLACIASGAWFPCGSGTHVLSRHSRELGVSCASISTWGPSDE